jgi:hypothetical protein
MVPDLGPGKLSILQEASVRGGLPPISPGWYNDPPKGLNPSTKTSRQDSRFS